METIGTNLLTTSKRWNPIFRKSKQLEDKVLWSGKLINLIPTESFDKVCSWCMTKIISVVKFIGKDY